MNPIEWLCANAPGFSDLVPEERDAIMHFSLLWSYFESKALNKEACARKIAEVARKWDE